HPVLACHELRIALLLCLVLVVANVVVPPAVLILGREAVETGYGIIETVLVAACLHQEDLETRLCEVGRQRPPARARTYDDVVEPGVIAHRALLLPYSRV